MDNPVVAHKSPYAADVGEGKSYWWRAGGRSVTQPFCGCRQTASPTLCDGTHSALD